MRMPAHSEPICSSRSATCRSILSGRFQCVWMWRERILDLRLRVDQQIEALHGCN